MGLAAMSENREPFVVLRSNRCRTRNSVRDAAPPGVHFQHPHLHRVSHRDDVQRMFHVPVRQLGNVHESVLADANVDEGAEVDDVAHRAHEAHARLQIVQVQDVRAQRGRRQVFPRIPPRTAQGCNDVLEGRLPHLQLTGKAGHAEMAAKVVKPLIQELTTSIKAAAL